MRVLVAGLVLILAAPAQTSLDAQSIRVIDFEMHWFRYMHDFLGCGGSYKEPLQDCTPARGSVNLQEFCSVRKGAMELFQLQPRKNHDYLFCK